MKAAISCYHFGYFLMILYPLNSLGSSSGGQARPPSTSTVAAWDAVLRTQKQRATEWWLIAQPDHAALAGDLASRIHCSDIPELDADVVQAISLHDEGWALFDGGEPMLKEGRPLPFHDVEPHDFLLAWRDSIEHAEKATPIGGVLVSEHFCRLAQMGLQFRDDTPEDVRMIGNFLEKEAERQKQLSRKQRRSGEEIRLLVDVLQFCDLLSLYLCCGSKESVEFPQRFNGRSIRIHREGELCRTEPSLFDGGVSLAARARKYPVSKGSSAISIPLLLT